MQENKENYRKNLSGALKGLSKETQREELHKARQNPAYWSSRNEKIEKKQGETAIDEGLGVYIKNKTLYHGSPVGGIQLFRPGETYTIGSGVYLTSQSKDAISYAKVRTMGNQHSRRILYEVSIVDIKLLDLRNAANVKKALRGFRQKLIELKATLRPSGNAFLDKVIQDGVDQRIKLIDEDKIDDNNIRDVTLGAGDAFTEYVQSLGYEGIVAYEGGESRDIFSGDHDSYVIFDPNRIRVIQEQDIAA